jgi:hypothetical protein
MRNKKEARRKVGEERKKIYKEMRKDREKKKRIKGHY